MIRCPMCRSIELRIVSVDIPWPDGTYANEYRCSPGGHCFFLSEAEIQALGDPGR